MVSPSMGGFILLLALLAAYSLFHWVLLSVEPAPPGSDGGNWLALSAELFGSRVKAASIVYPPIFPALLGLAQVFLPPLLALKILGLMAAAAVSIPLFVILRTALSPWLAAVLAAAAVAMDYHNEVFAWGGYPQLLGAAFSLASLYLLARGLETERARPLVAAALFSGLAIATHSLATVQLALAGGLLVLIHFYEKRAFRFTLKRAWLMPAGAIAIILLVLAPVYLSMLATLSSDLLNPQRFSLLEFFRNFASWRIENYMWLGVALAGAPAVTWAVLSRRGSLLARVSAAAMASSILTFTIIHEIRSAHLLQIGLLLSVGVIFIVLKRMKPGRYLASVITIICLCAVLLLGTHRSWRANDWYRVVDRPVLAALDFVKANAMPGDRAVVNEGNHGGIMGWWVEGYSGVPTYLAVETRWLSFQVERQQAAIAWRFVSPDATVPELSGLAQANRIRFLVLYKGTLRQALPNLNGAGFSNAFENEKVIIYAFRGRPS